MALPSLLVCYGPELRALIVARTQGVLNLRVVGGGAVCQRFETQFSKSGCVQDTDFFRF